MPCALCSLQQFWLLQILQRSFIRCTISEALPKILPDGTNLLHLPIWVKSKCFFTSPLCFRLYKGLLLQIVELLARNPDLAYDFRCCLHNKRPAMRKIWGHLPFPSNPHVSRIGAARLPAPLPARKAYSAERACSLQLKRRADISVVRLRRICPTCGLSSNLNLSWIS
jgi:hypothetical protein